MKMSKPDDTDMPQVDSTSISELQDIIKRKDHEINILIKRAEKAERLLSKANGYNDDLKAEIASLSSELHEYRSLKKHGKSVQLQVSESELNEESKEKPMPTWGSSTHEVNLSSSIAESLKAVAEEVIQDQDHPKNKEGLEEKPSETPSEYVYDAQSGFYYHPASGYYWDPTSCLFYDYTSGVYYQYDEAANEYKVHSQVDLSSHNQCHLVFQPSPSNVDSLSSQFSVLSITNQRYQKNALELAENHPPCIRLIVLRSEQLKEGSLHIITCAGGTIGREPNSSHVLEIPDLNVSKIHAQVDYDYDQKSYFIVDKGSQNGTLLNEKRLSESKVKSAAHKLHHGDVLEVGSSRLLLHIHAGHETCEDCEPGQVQAKLRALNPVKNDHAILSKDEKNRQRFKELKQIKKKYGLQNSHFESASPNLSDSNYTDKAYLRRKYVGSESTDTQQDEMPASVQSPISTSNKGHKLLSKMGWKEGEGLGKTSSGIAAPVNVELRVNQKAGLGSSLNHSLSLDNIHKTRKAQRWANAQLMYNKLESQEAHKESLKLNTSSVNEVDMAPPSSSSLSSSSIGVSDHFTDSQPMFPSSKHLLVSPPKPSSVPKISWVKGATQNPPTNKDDI